jgi:DNA-binding PadR family transcriptional regulator
MAERGWLRAAEPARAKRARVYRLTPRGRRVLTKVRAALDELYGEAGGGGAAWPDEHHASSPNARSIRSSRKGIAARPPRLTTLRSEPR